jgi:hypothetical protein
MNSIIDLTVSTFSTHPEHPAVNAQFVLRANQKNVLPLVGRDERVYEVVDRDDDLLAIVQAVKEASGARLR